MAVRTRASGGSSRPRRTAVAPLLLLAAAASACLGDPAPDPAVQPLEVVVGSETTPDQPCLLNVAEVGAGTHDVTVISQSGPATVRILDPAGTVVLEAEAEGGESAAQPGSVELEAGTYRVECRPASGSASETELRVSTPAEQPGY